MAGFALQLHFFNGTFLWVFKGFLGDIFLPLALLIWAFIYGNIWIIFSRVPKGKSSFFFFFFPLNVFSRVFGRAEFYLIGFWPGLDGGWSHRKLVACGLCCNLLALAELRFLGEATARASAWKKGT